MNEIIYIKDSYSVEWTGFMHIAVIQSVWLRFIYIYIFFCSRTALYFLTHSREPGQEDRWGQPIDGKRQGWEDTGGAGMAGRHTGVLKNTEEAIVQLLLMKYLFKS
jgi:hypothetical protein